MGKETNQISTIDKISFGIGDLGNGLSMQIIGSYLVFFMTAILGVPGTMAGLIVGVSIFWDAVTDPIMGYISDHTRSEKYGRRHLYLMIGMLGVSISNIALFSLPVKMDMLFKVVLITFFILLYKTSITILVTPYTALGSELSSDYNERARIQSIKSIFFTLGVGLSMVAGMRFFFNSSDAFPLGQLNPAGYRNMAIVTAAFSMSSMSLCIYNTKKYIPRLNKQRMDEKQRHSVKDILNALTSSFSNQAFKFVALSYMFSNIATAFTNNMGIHVFTYTFGFQNTSISTIFALQILFNILSQPLWIKYIERYDKKRSILLALSLVAIGCVYVIGLIPFRTLIQGETNFFIPYAILAGLGTGAWFVPASMVADAIDLEELEVGHRSEATYFGSMTFIYKLSQALTVPIIGILLEAVAFNANASTQTPSTQVALALILGIGTLLGIFFAALSIGRYPLSKEKIRKIQEELSSKTVES